MPRTNASVRMSNIRHLVKCIGAGSTEYKLLHENEKRDVDHWIQLHGCANGWSGTTGTMAAEARRVILRETKPGQ